MQGEIKDFYTNQIERALITDQGDTYLVKPYMLESDGRIMSNRHFPSYTLSKDMEGFEYAIYLQEEEV